MASRKLINSVLLGFLGTYTSRYSEFEGYFLFGFIVDSFSDITIDLLNFTSSAKETSPYYKMNSLAVEKFREQLDKAKLPFSMVKSATLSVRKGASCEDLLYTKIKPMMVSGFDFTFTARAVSDTGRIYEKRVTIFVAPHNPKLFRWSGRN